MTNNPALIEQLGAYISEQILKQPKRILQPGEKLISSGLVDSFSLVDLSLFIEETYAVKIDDTELNAATFDSLNELAALIESRQAPKI